MTDNGKAGEPLGQLQMEAIDWVVRLGLGRPSADDERALARWRARSAAHEEAWRTASGFADELRALPLPGVARGAVTPLARRPMLDRRAVLAAGGGAIAASIAGAMAVNPPAGLWPSWAELTAQHRTGPGERTAFAPRAGVNVELNTRTSISTADNNAGVNLINGEAFVAVQDQARPFLLHAADGVVACGAGAFGVRKAGADLDVTCAAGVVSARRAGRAVQLNPGDQALISPSGAARQGKVDLALALAWRRGLLIFHGTPLSTAIEEINRYYPGRLVLTDAAAAAQPINGVFHTNQIRYAVVQIQQLAGLHATWLPAGVVLLG